MANISFAPSSAEPQSTTVIYFAAEGAMASKSLQTLDARMGGALTRAIEVADFKGKRKSTLELLAPHGLRAARLLLAGVGDAKTLTRRDWAEIGGAIRSKLPKKTQDADVIFTGLDGVTEESPVAFALGFNLRSYEFKKYKTKASSKPDSEDPQAESELGPIRLTIYSDWGELAQRFQKEEAVASGVYLARDLVNEPANILTPPEFSNRLRELEAVGLTVEVLDEQALKSLGMNALLAVGQGSSQPSYVVVLRWNGSPGGAPKDETNLVFIGKGVCFDTGGISIKPAQGMEEMKGDMAGAAAVAGVMKALALRKAPVRAIGLVGLVENMPSGTAFRPGDVLVSASGQTIEVLNTDAEGRLLLADLLWYAQTFLHPKCLITLATLTGAILVALGKENAGLFANDDELASRIIEAGAETGEPAWRLPLSQKYDKMINSKVADMKNIGGRDAGSITAAQFLQRFVRPGTPWAHLDIAGTAMASPATDVNQSWASGYGVRLLDRLSEKFYER